MAKRVFFVLAVAGALAAGAARAAENSAPASTTPAAVPAVMTTADPASFLRPGESLIFRLGWGLIGNAGQTRFETTRIDTPEGPRVQVTVTTASRGLVDAVYPLSNTSVSLIDPATGRTMQVETKGRAGKRDLHTTTIFDYAAGQIVHTDHIRPGRSATVPMPETPVHDLMVAMMQARMWKLKPGETRELQCTYEDDFYHFELKALRRARLRTPAGSFDAVEIEPKPKGELKGMFKKGGSIKFWISQGDDPQIVRIDTKIDKAGTVVASLEEVIKPKDR